MRACSRATARALTSFTKTAAIVLASSSARWGSGSDTAILTRLEFLTLLISIRPSSIIVDSLLALTPTFAPSAALTNSNMREDEASAA